MILQYFQWKDAIRAEYLKLSEVSFYLSEDGKERLQVFDLLDTLASYFTDTAAELLEQLDSNDVADDVAEMLKSKHSSAPIKALRKIVNH